MQFQEFRVHNSYETEADQLLEQLTEKQANRYMETIAMYRHGQRFATVDAIRDRLRELKKSQNELADDLGVPKDRLSKELSHAGPILEDILCLPQFTPLKKRRSNRDRRMCGWRFVVPWVSTIVLDLEPRSTLIEPLLRDEFLFLSTSLAVERFDGYVAIWRNLPEPLIEYFPNRDLDWFVDLLTKYRPALLLAAKELENAQP